MTSRLAMDHRLQHPPTRLLRLLETAPAANEPAGEPLIERDHELAELQSAVQRLTAGGGGVVVIDAAAGMGKTALLERASTLAAHAGCLVRRAAPGPGERDFPFGVIRSLLEAALRETSPRERRDLLDGAAAPAGALLLSDSAATGLAPTTYGHGIFWLCAGFAARQPLALLVDDAQWSDRVSLEVLAYLARRIEDVPLLIVVAARAGDPRAPTDLLSLIGGVRAGTVLHPRPLSRKGAARLIRRLAPGTPITACRDLHRAVGGDPWLLGELARLIQDRGVAAIDGLQTGTPSVTSDARHVVRRRLAELMPRDRAVAAALAVIGGDPPPHVIAELADVRLGELGLARDALRAAGLGGPDHDGFAHPLLAAVIKEDLPATERERLQRESARALMTLGAPAHVFAGHVMQIRPQGNPDVSDLLRHAACEATEHAQPAAAVRYLERALAERAPADERGRMLVGLAAARYDAGMPDPRDPLHEALEHGGNRASRLDALTALAALAVAEGGGVGVIELLERELAQETDLGARMAIEAAVLDALAAVPDRHAERAWRASVIDLTTATDPVLRSVGLAHQAWLATERASSDAADSAGLALEALNGGLLLGESSRRAAFHLCIRVLVMTDRAEDARRAISSLEQRASIGGSAPIHAAAAWHGAELALRTGEVTEAEERARAALRLGGEDLDAVSAGAITVLVSALAERGAFAHAHELLAARGLDGPLGGRSWEVGVLHARARLWLAQGEFDRAGADARQAGAGREFQGRPNPTWTPWRSTASLALAHLGHREQAVTLADAELTLAEAFGAPVPIARALIARAVAEPDDAARLAICQRGLALVEGGGGVLETVGLRLELGSTLKRMGRRVDAREALRPALADADSVGATLLAQRARRELVATGLRPRRAALEGACSLTPRQREICELALAGKGNRAIAQQLFLSIKTVETHLAVCYRKLGVATRGELAAALAI